MQTQPPRPERVSFGLDENVAAALAYAVGWVTGVAFLLTEHQSRFVRFHALQSTIMFGALSIAWVVGLAIPLLGWIVSFVVVVPLSAFLWLFLMFKAYQGQRYKLPIVGALAEQHL